MEFSSLGLSPSLLRAIVQKGYTNATPIQAAAIPLVLDGGDVLAAAQTGTGKTAAFALPLLERLFPGGQRAANAQRPRVLVLTPTRELAAQVAESFGHYGRDLRVRVGLVFGGVGMQPQVDTLRRGVDILVATPGRLIDHLQQRTVDLSGVEALVLDEADRMLDMGFLPAIRRLLSALPTRRQTLLFSATFSPDIKQLAGQFLHLAREVQVAPANSIATTISHRVHPVDAEARRDLLVELLRRDRLQTLVFSRTKHGADKLAKQLVQAGIAAAAIHGNKSQSQRTRALGDFKSGNIEVLVATDIAARGLDISGLPRVINHELPLVAEDYVHRIGRTGRAGVEGIALSLVAAAEVDRLRDIRKLLGDDIVVADYPGFEPMTRLPPFDAAPDRGRNGAQARRPHPQPTGDAAPASKPRRRRRRPAARKA